MNTDCIPTASPAIAFVALPVFDASPIYGMARTLIPKTGSIPV